MIPQIENGLLRVKSGGEGDSLILDLSAIAEVEVRLDEIASVTKLKAPELLSTFTVAWKKLHECLVQVQSLLVAAKRDLDRTRAVVLLDKVPGILKDRGLASSKSPMGSEDLRKSILDLDEDFNSASEQYNYLECVYELLKGKQKSFQMGYEAVKKILGDSNYLDSVGGISATTGEQYEANGFGTPRY